MVNGKPALYLGDEELKLHEPGCPHCGHDEFTFVVSRSVTEREVVRATLDSGLCPEIQEPVDSEIDYDGDVIDEETEYLCDFCGSVFDVSDVETAMEWVEDDFEDPEDRFSWTVLGDLGIEFVKPWLQEHALYGNRFILEEHPHLVVLRADQVGTPKSVAGEVSHCEYQCPSCGTHPVELDGERRHHVTDGRDEKGRPVMLVVQTCYCCRR